mgnify:CR=1 FL=1
MSKAFNRTDITKLYVAILGIVLFSFLWMPASLEYLKNKSDNYKYIVLGILFMVALSTFMTILFLNSVSNGENVITKRLAIGGMSYFFIHVFFFDFILWSYNFF